MNGGAAEAIAATPNMVRPGFERILIVSDAWEPQVNGVVRTLRMTTAELRRMGHTVDVIGPDRFRTVPWPAGAGGSHARTGRSADPVHRGLYRHQGSTHYHRRRPRSTAVAGGIWLKRRSRALRPRDTTEKVYIRVLRARLVGAGLAKERHRVACKKEQSTASSMT